MSPAPPRIVVVGEALIDIVRSAHGEQSSHPGGSPANVAIGLAELGHPVDLATWIGAHDEHGRVIEAHLRDHGVNLMAASRGATRTPTAVALLDEHGSAEYQFDLEWKLAEVDLAGVGHLHAGSIAATLEPGGSTVLATMMRAHELGTVSYDPNLRPSIMGHPHDVRSRIEECIGRSDVVKASADDVDGLYDGAPPEVIAELWGQLGPSLVVITSGGNGALLSVSHTGQRTTVPGQRVDVADTVGAGDSFMAGLISGLLDDGFLGSLGARQRLRAADLDAVLPAVRRGIATSAYTVRRAGAVAPTRRDLGIAPPSS